jgi:parallel beta-helix repeat protein
VKKVFLGLFPRLIARFSSMIVSSANPMRARPAHEPVELRLLYSADVAPFALAVQLDAAQPAVMQQGLTQVVSSAQAKPSIELVVIDSRVSDIAPFLNDIAEQQAQGRALVLVEINASDDGLAIISDALNQALASGQEVSAIHIVSHGRDGEFDLGKQTISQSTLRTNSNAFAQWASAFSANGDLLIYGCNFAQSAKGQEFALSLAALTGADVAANLQATGAQALGGDWVLDFTTGKIEANDVSSASFQSAWQHLLDVSSVDPTPQLVNTGSGGAFTGLPSNTTLSSGGRSVAVAANGDYVIVWENDLQDVKYRRFNADGSAKDATERALVTSSFLQKQPSVAMADDGSFVIAWANSDFFGNVTIKSERYDSSGNSVGTTTDAGSLPNRSSVAIDATTKDFILVWEAGSSGREVYTRSYSWGGTAKSSAFRVNDSSAFDATRPSVTIRGGRGMVVWETQDSDSGGIKYRDFNLDGSNIRNEFLVNQDQQYNQNAPDIGVARSNGNFVITWQTTNTAVDDGTRFRIFDQDLNPTGSSTLDRLVTSNAPGNQNLPKVVVADDGRFVIVQQDDNLPSLDTSGKAVMIIAFNSDGTVDPNFTETSLSYVSPNDVFVMGDQTAPAVAWRGGQVVTAWTTGASGTDSVLSRRVDIGTAPGLIVTPPASIFLVERQPAKQIGVRLTTAPTSNVQVSGSVSNSQGGVTTVDLVFTPTNWNIVQYHGVAATIDGVIDPDTQFDVTLSTYSVDTRFQNILTAPVTFVSVDEKHNIVVDTTSDILDGDTSSIATLLSNRGADGLISLREAITAANNTVNLPTEADQITFNIPLGNFVTNPQILLTYALPEITDKVSIDGTTQTNTIARGNYVTLTGSLDGVTPALPFSAYNGLMLGPGSDGSKISGLAVTGFREHGVLVRSSNNTFENNYLGFSPFNLALARNTMGGIHLYSDTLAPASGNIIQNNVLSNNQGHGIQLNGADNNTIRNNKIGTNAAGNAALANGGDGILINTLILNSNYNGAVGNQVSGNTLSGNTYVGIRVLGGNTDSNLIKGNFIGRTLSGAAIGNGGGGVVIQGTASSNWIGGDGANDGNFIGNNGGNGVSILGAHPTDPPGFETGFNVVIGNSIFNNAGIGIDLAPYSSAMGDNQYGVTANDVSDDDNGPNAQTNFPILTAASNNGVNTRIVGNVDAQENAYYRIEFFASSSADATGHGEGSKYLGFRNVSSDSDGKGAFQFDSTSMDLPVGTYISATATRTASNFLPSGFWQTSEFSLSIRVIGAPAFAISSPIFYVDENVTYSLNVKSDLQNPSQTGIQFSIEPGADGNIFLINPVTGILTFQNAANYEALLLDTPADNEWWVTVKASDGVFSSTLLYIFHIQDVNERPVVAYTPDLTVAEDTTVPFVGTNRFIITDFDTGTTNNSTPVKVTISAINASGASMGSLTYGNNVPNILITALAGSFSLEGKLSDINAALQDLSITPNFNDTQDLFVTLNVEDFGSGISSATNLSQTAVMTIHYAAVNDPPSLIIGSSTPRAVPFMGTINLAGVGPLAIQVADVDTTTLQATVSVTAGSLFLPLSYASLVQSASSTSVTLLGTASALQNALNEFQYTASATGTGTQTVNIAVNDSNSITSRSVTLQVAANDLPTITGLTPALVFTENQAPLFLAPNLVLADTNHLNLVAASVRVADGFHIALDNLQLITYGLTASFDSATATLSLTGSASLATYQNVLRTLSYSNSADVPHTEQRVIQFKVFDGYDWSAPQSVFIDVHALNDAPTATVSAALTVPFAGTLGLLSQGGVLVISDADAEGTSVQVTLAVDHGTLSLFNPGGLTIALGSVGADAQLIVRGSIADINSALLNLTYTATVGFVGVAQFSLIVDDLGNTGDGGAKTSIIYKTSITVQAGVKPVLVNASGNFNFTEGSAGTFLMPNLQVGGTNTNQITQAEIRIVSGFESGLDQLNWATPPAYISVAWNTTTGTLSITGIGTFTDYESLLRTVEFKNSSENPSSQVRVIESRAFDGLQWSDTKTIAMNVTPVNDAPVLVSNASMVTNEDVILTFSALNAWTVSDVDSAQLRLSLEVSNGTLRWNSSTAVPNGFQSSASNIVTLSGSAAQINAWASSIIFTPDADFFGTSNVRWSLTDVDVSPLVITSNSTIRVNPVNDAPTAQAGNDLKAEQGAIVQITTAQAQALDVDNQAEQLTYRLSALPTSGVLLLNGQVLNNTVQFTQADIDNGKLQYRHNGLVSTTDSFSYEVFDIDGLRTTSRTVKIDIALRPVLVVQNTAGVGTSSGTQATSTTSYVGVAEIVRGAETKSTQSNAAGGDSNSAVAIAPISAGSQPNVQKAVSKSIGVPASSSNSSTDYASSLSSGAANGVVRQTDSNRLADDKLKPDLKHSSGPVFGEGVRLDNLASLGFSRIRTAAEGVEYAQIVRTALSDRGFIDDVQKVGDDAKQTLKLDRNVVASTTAVSAGLSIGYVIWLVRGGALLSSLLASIPAWRVMDPLPILGSMGDNADESDDESLDAMIDKANQKKLELAQRNPGPGLALDAAK